MDNNNIITVETSVFLLAKVRKAAAAAGKSVEEYAADVVREAAK